MRVKNPITAPYRNVRQKFLLQQIFRQGEKGDAVVIPPQDVLLVHDVDVLVEVVLGGDDVGCAHDHV